MSDNEYYESSRRSAIRAVEDRGIGNTNFSRVGMRLSVYDIITLCYAARMVNDVAVSQDEYDKIMESVRSIEGELGVKYAFDSQYNDD